MAKSDYTWNFNEYFQNDEEFLKTKDQFLKDVERLNSKLDKLNLEDKLKYYYDLKLISEKLYTYTELKYDSDLNNQTYVKYKDEAYKAKGKLDPIKNNINDEINKIDISLDEYMKIHPNCQDYYMHFYEVLRCKKHNINSNLVTKETISIENVNTLYNTITDIELPSEEIEIEGKKIKVNKATYSQYSKNKNRDIRKDVFKAYSKCLEKSNKSVSGLFNLRYQMCYDIALEKNYNSILEQVISEDDLSMKIINTLLSSVHKHLNLLNRYLTLRKQKLNLDELHFYDLIINDDYNPKYTFEEAIEIVKDALKIMGKTYNEKLDKALTSGCIDAFPRKNKFTGGYHFRNYIKPMILMNYKNNFREVPIIAHELGHAVNGIMVKENQNYQDFHFSAFLSEVASIVNEDRIENYLYEKADTNNKIIHLDQIINKMIIAIFMNTLYLEFQKNICEHLEKGNSLNSTFINDTFIKLYKQYYNSIVIDEELKYFWQTRLHFFYGQYRYYNFQYATGKIASLVINKNIDEGKIQDYLKYLTIGGSKPTLEALKIAGVDLENQEIYENAFDYLNSLIDDYEILIKKEKNK